MYIPFFIQRHYILSVGGCNAKNKTDHGTPPPGRISMKSKFYCTMIASFSTSTNNNFIPECLEYSKYVYSEQSGLTLLARSQTRNISQCHIDAIPLVVGGEPAHDMEFPHMVILHNIYNRIQKP